MGQNSEYKVFYYSGNPLFKAKNKTEKLVRDQVLDQSATLSIPANSYVVLVNKSEVPMGINKPGDYSVSDIKKLYTNMTDSNLTEEFFNYIASSMLESNDKNRRSGGVYRAVGDLMINPFDAAVVVEKTVPFEWNNPNQKQYYFKIFDIETWNMVCDIPTTDSVYNLDIESQKLAEGKEYAWVVTQTSGVPQSGTELFVFTVSGKDFKKDLDKQLKDAEKKSADPQMRRMMKLRVYIDNCIYPIPPYTQL
ncbi:MAG TPA: hypothetical protein PKV50_08285 [Prolixibacteraceae bacterium]|nr:hypothetical protein [Prolixibacteraceae bacterium]